jgi:hypothetical protein
MRRRTVAVLVLIGVLLVGGCSGGDDDTAGTSSATTEIVVQVADGKVMPPTHRVKVDKGATIRLRVTSDTEDALHVHGYDIEQELPAGKQATLEFTADETGLFEVETHESELQLVQLEVR